MKTIAWLAAIGTLAMGVIYMVVSLNRWEWNRALFFGLIVLIAEVGIATGLILRRLDRLERTKLDPAVMAILQDTRPSTPHRFDWLEDASSQMNVFITFLVGGGIILSGLAWVADKVAANTSTPIGEEQLARQLGAISYPRGGLLVDEVTALAQDVPGTDDGQIRKLLNNPPTLRVTTVGRVALGLVGLVLGGLAVSALREATLSTHQAIAEDSRVAVVVEVESEGREATQTADEMIEALFVICRLEVNSDLVGEIEPLPPRPDDDDALYRAVLQPAMDPTNRRQFRGCLEDWTLDQLLVDVVAFEDTP